MKVKRFGQYSLEESLVDDFILSFQDSLNEQSTDEASEIIRKYKEKFGEKKPTNQEFADFYHELRNQGHDGVLIFDTLDPILQQPEDPESGLDTYKRIEKKVISDLKLDGKLVLTFGAGIGALYPVIQKMMSNMSIASIEMTAETAVLLTIASVTIAYLEEKKCKSAQEEEKLTKDSKSMLEELRMRGIGDGIVKKVIKALQSIKNVFSLIGKHIGAIVGGVIDMFAYTGVLIPIMNAILFLIGKYEMNPDTIIQNFFSLGVGVASRIAKHSLVELINKLKDRFNINKEKIVGEIETPVIQKFSNYVDQEPKQDGEMINDNRF